MSKIYIKIKLLHVVVFFSLFVYFSCKAVPKPMTVYLVPRYEHAIFWQLSNTYVRNRFSLQSTQYYALGMLFVSIISLHSILPLRWLLLFIFEFNLGYRYSRSKDTMIYFGETKIIRFKEYEKVYFLDLLQKHGQVKFPSVKVS